MQILKNFWVLYQEHDGWWVNGLVYMNIIETHIHTHMHTQTHTHTHVRAHTHTHRRMHMHVDHIVGCISALTWHVLFIPPAVKVQEDVWETLQRAGVMQRYDQVQRQVPRGKFVHSCFLFFLWHSCLYLSICIFFSLGFFLFICVKRKNQDHSVSVAFFTFFF